MTSGLLIVISAWLFVGYFIYYTIRLIRNRDKLGNTFVLIRLFAAIVIGLTFFAALDALYKSLYKV